jgi:hypothetical protein
MFYRFFVSVRSALPITIGAGWIGAPIGVAEYNEDACVQCASPVFIPIAYKLSLTNRKRKYVAEKTTGPLKSKQTSITTVRCPILSVARLQTPLIFRYPLPLKSFEERSQIHLSEVRIRTKMSRIPNTDLNTLFSFCIDIFL